MNRREIKEKHGEIKLDRLWYTTRVDLSVLGIFGTYALRDSVPLYHYGCQGEAAVTIERYTSLKFGLGITNCSHCGTGVSESTMKILGGIIRLEIIASVVGRLVGGNRH